MVQGKKNGTYFFMLLSWRERITVQAKKWSGHRWVRNERAFHPNCFEAQWRGGKKQTYLQKWVCIRFLKVCSHWHEVLSSFRQTDTWRSTPSFFQMRRMNYTLLWVDSELYFSHLVMLNKASGMGAQRSKQSLSSQVFEMINPKLKSRTSH